VKGGKAGQSAVLFGEALKLTPGLREKIVIVAKMDIIFPSTIDTSSNHLTSILNWFLEALGTNYIDIVLLHYQNSYMNPNEIALTFADFKAAGKVLHFGTSNHFPIYRDVLQKALNPFNISLVTNEIELSVWNPGYLNYNSNLVADSMLNGYRNLAWGVSNIFILFLRCIIYSYLTSDEIITALRYHTNTKLSL